MAAKNTKEEKPTKRLMEEALEINAEHDLVQSADNADDVDRTARALTLVQQSRLEILSVDPKQLTEAALVTAFVISVRMKNAVERRVSSLRKVVDKIFDKPGREILPGMPGIRLSAPAPNGEKFVIVKDNGAADDTVVDEELARKLCQKKNVDFDKTCLVQEPQPPKPDPYFSAEKFKAMMTLGVISQKEYEACVVPAQPKCSVTVEAPPEVDAAISMALLGHPPERLLARTSIETDTKSALSTKGKRVK